MRIRRTNKYIWISCSCVLRVACCVLCVVCCGCCGFNRERERERRCRKTTMKDFLAVWGVFVRRSVSPYISCRALRPLKKFEPKYVGSEHRRSITSYQATQQRTHQQHTTHNTQHATRNTQHATTRNPNIFIGSTDPHSDASISLSTNKTLSI